MTRKLWVIATVTLFGVSAALAGIGLTHSASACDDATKTAAATTSSCCAKDGAKSASADAQKVHNSMIKSAVFAPGAAPIMNVAAMGGMTAKHADCDWCPEMTTAAVNASQGACATQMSAAACATTMSAEDCAAMKASGACTGAAMTKTASYETVPAGHATITTADAGHAGCNGSMATVASSEGCAAKTASVTLAAGGDGCTDKSASSASSHGQAGCCESKTASAAGSGEKCASAQSASLKGKVDEMPYRESKRVVLAGSYACGHCTLQKTEDCSPMLKTADGKVYPLLQNNNAMEMRSKEGKNLEVSGTVKKVDGIKFLEVKSFKVM